MWGGVKGGGEGGGGGGDVVSDHPPLHIIERAPGAQIDKYGRCYDIGNFIYSLFKNEN